MIERIPFNVASMTQKHTQIHAWGGSFTQLLHPSFCCTCRWRLQQLLKPKLLLPKQPLKPSQSGDTDSLKRAKVKMSSFQIVCSCHSLDQQLTLQCWHLRVTSYCLKKAPGFNFLICCTRLAIKRKTPFINILFDIVTTPFIWCSLSCLNIHSNSHLKLSFEILKNAFWKRCPPYIHSMQNLACSCLFIHFRCKRQNQFHYLY